MSAPIGHIAVIGGGVAAAMAALALARRVPNISVTWIDTGVPQDSIEDVLGAARPSLSALHQAMGIDDAELLRRIHCGQRRGTFVEDWGPDTFFRGHDRLPAGLPGVPLHLIWLRLREGSGDSIPWIDLASHIGKPKASPPALLLDIADYRAVLTALAKSTGIRRVLAASVAVELDPDRPRVATVRLPDGEAIRADLFLDATGPARVLASRLPGGWIDWTHQVPTRSVSIGHTVPAGKPVLHDRLVAEPNGWQLQSYLPDATVSIVGRGDDPGQGDDAGPAPIQVGLRSGRLRTPFSGNVVALGSAAMVLDPIGATALHLICRQIERLIAYLPGRNPDPVEIDLYNRRSALDADRMRDFVQLHFALGPRDTPFWQAALGPWSDQLTLDISLFDARGRLPIWDEDGFEQDEWISTLLGLGRRPVQRDALAFAVSVDKARDRIMSALERPRAVHQGDLY